MPQSEQRQYTTVYNLAESDPAVTQPLFDTYQLWAAWRCKPQDQICCRILKDKYSCMCGHRLKDHAAVRLKSGKTVFKCQAKGCACSNFRFQVQDNSWQARCGCKHKGCEHELAPPHKCMKPGCKCEGFACNWQCHCGEPYSAHDTIWTVSPWPRGGRQWVTQGLRKETAELARKIRARPAAQVVNDVLTQTLTLTLIAGRKGRSAEQGG